MCVYSHNIFDTILEGEQFPNCFGRTKSMPKTLSRHLRKKF